MGKSEPATSLPAPLLAVLVSGKGSILEAIMAAGLPIALVLADRPCRALDHATAAGLPTVMVDRTTYGWPGTAASNLARHAAGFSGLTRPGATWDRPAFTAAVLDQLASHHIGLVAMAGFMTILSPALFAAYPGRVLNTHPSLLPAFPGAHAVADTLAAGVTTTGCTVHIATADLDAGPILAQATVPIHPGDTPATLQERIKITERELYPRVIQEQLAALTRSA